MKPNIRYPAFRREVWPFIHRYSDNLIVTKYKDTTEFAYYIDSPMKSLGVKYMLVLQKGHWKSYMSTTGGSKESYPSKRRISFSTFDSKFHQYILI